MTAFIHSPAWLKVKRELIADREQAVNQLVACKTHDESNIIRGNIARIDDILERYPVILGLPDKDDD